MMWSRFFRQWLALVLVLVSVTSCELERYGASTALPEVECPPGEWNHKGQCVPAGLPPDMPCPPGELALGDGRCQPAGLPLDMKCQPGELELADGRCQPAGLPLDMQCQPGELELQDGTCQPAGVPPEMCGPGFEPDGEMGCNAILPPAPCPFGLMAVPGETECREVAPCGEGKWGDIPVGEMTQFVDGAYAGNDSDGSKERPWRTIAEGIAAAKPEAVVAIAEGIYQENLFIDKHVEVWGICPKKVTVVGDGTSGATMEISSIDADRTEIHNLAITGAARGLRVYGTRQLSIDGIWIHDTNHLGIVIWNDLHRAQVTINSSLIEETNRFGIAIMGSEVAVLKSVVRDTQLVKGEARGIDAVEDDETNTQSHLTIHGSLIERIPEMGVRVLGSEARIEATALRDVGGWGVGVILNGATGKPAYATMSELTVERVTDVGIFVWDSVANVASSTLRGSTVDTFGRGRGIMFQGFPGHSDGEIVASTVVDQEDEGILILNSNAAIEGCRVKNTHSDDTMANEIGIFVTSNSNASTHRSNVTVRGASIESNEGAGVVLLGSTATIDQTVTRGMQYYGLEVSNSSDVVIRASRIEENEEYGISVVDSKALMETSVVRNTNPHNSTSDQASIRVSNTQYIQKSRSNMTIRGSVLEDNNGVGILIEGTDVTVEDTVVRGSKLWGIRAEDNHDTRVRSNVVVKACMIEQNLINGVSVLGSDLTLETSIVRGTLRDAQGEQGTGVIIRADLEAGATANAIVRTSLIEQNQYRGISMYGAHVTIDGSRLEGNTRLALFSAGSTLTINATVIRTTELDAQGTGGWGISIQEGAPLFGGSSATITNSLVEDNHEVGVFVEGSNATIDATIVRRTQPNGQGLGGRGVEFEYSTGTIHESLVEDNHEVGMHVGGSDVTVEMTVVRGTKPTIDGLDGRGINIQISNDGDGSKATIRDSLVESNHHMGVFIAESHVLLERTTIRGTESNDDGQFGDGIVVMSVLGLTTATITNVHVEESDRAGISNFGGVIELHSSALQCNGYDMSTQRSNGQLGTFNDNGNNHCGCPDATGVCIMANVVLEPPTALPPIDADDPTP